MAPMGDLLPLADPSSFPLQVRQVYSMPWIQRTVSLPPHSRGLHLVTSHVVKALPELRSVRIGLLHVFIQHTSASLSINENADPDVPRDLEASINAIAPEEFPYRHTLEGPDDMPAHIKAAMMPVSLSIPVSRGRMMLGTWQGIYLFEHRDAPHRREIAAHLA